MTYYSMDNYKLIGFRKSNKLNKKYDAIIKNNKNGKLIYIPFGDINYFHFKDSTPNKLYSNLNHLNNKRRILYQKRHIKYLKPGYYSPGYFSYYMLW